MAQDDVICGEVVQAETPDWQPLYDLVGVELADWFMWMFEIELADGARVHAYKHVATRCYLHLAYDGRSLLYTRGGRYREIGRGWSLHLAFREWEELSSWPEDPERAQDAREALEWAIQRAFRADDEHERGSSDQRPAA